MNTVVYKCMNTIPTYEPFIGLSNNSKVLLRVKLNSSKMFRLEEKLAFSPSEKFFSPSEKFFEEFRKHYYRF